MSDFTEAPELTLSVKEEIKEEEECDSFLQDHLLGFLNVCKEEKIDLEHGCNTGTFMSPPLNSEEKPSILEIKTEEENYYDKHSDNNPSSSGKFL